MQRPSTQSRSYIVEPLEARQLLAFGVTTTTGGAASYVIDNGGDLKVTVLRNGATTSSTVHLGDITSIKYKNQEMLATYAVTSRHSHYEQGLSGASTISYTIDPSPTPQWILVKADDSGVSSGAVIHYYAVRRNDNNIYMASLPIDVTNGPGEGRYIAYLDRNVFTAPEEPSDNAGNTGAIEGGDVFGHAGGITTSKFYNMGRRMIENEVHGLTGIAGGVPVGAWMYMGDREHSAGGAFFKDIDFQSSSAVEIYNCIFTGHTQTETYREGLHTYSFQFTDGSAPIKPDYAWMEALNLQGWIPAAQRGTLTGTTSGVPVGQEVTVALSNAAAQYWDTPDAAGNYAITDVQPGTYTQTLYAGELEVGQKTVTIPAGATTHSNIVNSFYIPSNPIFRIGTWDGTPIGFLNSDKIEIMHPSDSRMTSWTSTPNFVVGTNSTAQWPMAQFMGVNNGQRITFNLTSVQALTLRIGVTLGFEGGRNKITVNGGQSYAWVSGNPTASRDLNSRGITRGTWRGDNQLWIFNIPTSGLRVGTNTIDLPVISGSYVSGQTWLSPNVVYDAIDLVPTSSASTPAIASVTVTPANSTVGTDGAKAFTAVARDAAGNVIPANIDWSAARGTTDPNGNYIAPATAGSDTITATATRTRTPGYNITSAISATISGSGSTNITVLDSTPVVVTPASASPNPTFKGSTALSVLGNDDGGESNLTYTWSLAGTPPAPVTFSANGTNAAKATTATFTANGTYNFLVTIADQQNHTITNSVAVSVNDKVVWYQSDVSGGTTLPDSSGNNLPATLSGSYNFVPGVSGNAVRFTGGAATLPSGVVSTLNDFTVTSWVKLDSLNTWSRIFDFGTGTTSYMFLTPQAGPTLKPRFAITTPGVAEQQVNSSVAIPTGVWTHLAITLSGNTATLYINGVNRGTNGGVTLRPSSLGNTTQNYIADSQFAADPALMGSIDEFRIFGRALSSTEITGLVGGTVLGQAFHDVNGNESLNGGETALNGVTVFLDGNNNGVLDPGEPSTVTSGAGNYSFAAVSAGSYAVRQLGLPIDYVASSVPSVTVSNGATANANPASARIVYTGTISADVYRLRKNGAGQYEIYIGASAAAPTYTVFAGVPSLTFNLGLENDSLTLDLSNGVVAPAGGVSFDGGAGIDVIAVIGSPADDVVQSSAGSIALGGGGSIAHANVENATYNTGGGWDSLTGSGGPAISLVAGQQFASLVLSGGASVAVSAANSALLTRGLDISGASRLDLADNDLLLDYGPTDVSPFAQIRQLVIGGLQNPATGIDSTSSTGDTVLAVVDNAVHRATSWSGIPIDQTTIIGKYTYYGDANFDGKVTSDDYVAVDVNLGRADRQWIHGDFNFNGAVTSDEYVAIDTNLGKGVTVGELLATAELNAEIVTTAAPAPNVTEPLATIVESAAATSNTYAVRPKNGWSIRFGRSSRRG